MSKSYRKPYSAWCGGNSSAKEDKRLAHRGERRAHNQYIRDLMAGNLDWDETPFPEMYECAHNEVYGWNRDGNQHPVPYPEYPHVWVFLFGQADADEHYQHCIDWYKKLCRK